MIKYENKSPKTVWFNGIAITGLNISLTLNKNGYFNDGVTYNALNGTVVCKYASSMGFDGFYLSSVMKNAKGGQVASSGSEEIHLRIPVGSP